MATQQRIYKISDKAGITQLVKASTQAQALRFAARGQFAIDVASGIDVADLMSAGLKVADASGEEEEGSAE
jgi:hypothetical protein